MGLRGRLACALALAVMGCGSITLGPDGGTGGGGRDGSVTGAAGTQGQAGTSGTAGTTGAAGTNGTGTAGVTGGAGTTGGAGSMGAAGSTGAAGTGGGCPGVTCNLYCQYGFEIGANNCPICNCKPPPACSTADCGPPPPFAQPLCPNGKVVPASCDRNAEGKCAWRAPSCLTDCPTLACPPIFCTNGYATDPATGCATCQCNPAPMCPAGTHAVTCPGVACTLACADGFKRGTDGCPVCACRAAATCAGPNVRCAACAFGYRTGPNGCTSCACQDPPEGCVANATGAQ
jgi:hypothetical protein